MCRAKLRAYMPELVPTWERLCALAGDDPEVARMLTLYRPTPYVAGCTQAVRVVPSPALVRNYDYHPHACEATFVRTRWTETTVMAASDCLWGALDGMNEHGLAVALAFGGSRTVGDGFGIPLIVRYVLETCATVAEARRVLRRVPSHMAYNVAVVDPSGAHALAYLRPGGEAHIGRETVSTNHQERIEWPEYVSATGSVERKRAARTALRETRDTASLVRRFLRPPLFVTDYVGWLGTLYTVAYRTTERSMHVHWRGASVTQAIEDFPEREFDVPYHSVS